MTTTQTMAVLPAMPSQRAWSVRHPLCRKTQMLAPNCDIYYSWPQTLKETAINSPQNMNGLMILHPRVAQQCNNDLIAVKLGDREQRDDSFLAMTTGGYSQEEGCWLLALCAISLARMFCNDCLGFYLSSYTSGHTVRNSIIGIFFEVRWEGPYFPQYKIKSHSGVLLMFRR